MRLSSLINNHEITWLWHAVRERDLPWVKAEGLIWRPHVWLTETRKAAVGFYPYKDRVILRVNARALNAKLLVKDHSWQQWVARVKRVKTAAGLPESLACYWASLRRQAEPELAARLRNGDSQDFKRDLRTQIARVRPDQLWRYDGRVEPTALSKINEAGFYEGLKPIPAKGRDEDE